MPIIETLKFKSSAVKKLVSDIEPFINEHNHLVILGESGVGKTEFAKWIHEQSVRKNNPLMIIDGKFFSHDTMSQALFGSESYAQNGRLIVSKGVFESCHNGTLIIKNPEKLPKECEWLFDSASTAAPTKLAFTRVNGETLVTADVRIISTFSFTDRTYTRPGSAQGSLLKQASNTNMSNYFLYKSDVNKFMFPSLAQRPEDIPMLVANIVAEFPNHHTMCENTVYRYFTASAIDFLTREDFSQNMVSLRHAVRVAFETLVFSSYQFESGQKIEPTPLFFPSLLGGKKKRRFNKRRAGSPQEKALSFISSIPNHLLPALSFKNQLLQVSVNQGLNDGEYSIESLIKMERQEDLARSLGISAKTLRKRVKLLKELEGFLAKTS